jgi:hypothetical protein
MEILGGIALGFAIPAFVLALRATARIKAIEQRLSLINGHAESK